MLMMEDKKIALDNDVPKDVKDEWSAPKEIHMFYFVKSIAKDGNLNMLTKIYRK